MAWGTETNATQLDLNTTTNESVFQISAADMKVELAPNEVMHLMVRCNRDAGTTGDCIIRVYASSDSAPGAVPDSAQTIAGSDWAIHQALRVPGADRSNEWQSFVIRGVRHISCSIQPTSASDSWLGDLKYSIGS